MLSFLNISFNTNEINWNNDSFHGREQIVPDEMLSSSFDSLEDDRPIKFQKVRYFSAPYQTEEPVLEEPLWLRTQWVALSSDGLETCRKLFDDEDEDEPDESSYYDGSLNTSFTEEHPYSSEEVSYSPVFSEDKGFDLKEEDMVIDSKEEVFTAEVEALEDESTRFFTDKEPEQWFSLFLGIDNKITVNIPGQIGQIAKLIYVFKNTENNKLLVGKTGQTFSERLSGYKQAFNSEVVDLDEKEFIADVRKNPEQFRVGILHALVGEEDLNDFETRFIDCKGAMYALYNKRRGGAGGLARSEEEPTYYAIPKDCPMTPPKRYPYKTNEEGQIRLALTPGFNRTVKKLSDSRTSPAQGFLYSIKSVSSGKRYVGGTMQLRPADRLRQHGYNAEVFYPENEGKFNPNATDGALHPAMGENPLDFTAGFLPVRYDVEDMSEEEKAKYYIVSTLGDAERKTIEAVGSLISQNGFNCNKGGGGPIADCRKRKVVHKRKADVLIQ